MGTKINWYIHNIVYTIYLKTPAVLPATQIDTINNKPKHTCFTKTLTVNSFIPVPVHCKKSSFCGIMRVSNSYIHLHKKIF